MQNQPPRIPVPRIHHPVATSDIATFIPLSPTPEAVNAEMKKTRRVLRMPFDVSCFNRWKISRHRGAISAVESVSGFVGVVLGCGGEQRQAWCRGTVDGGSFDLLHVVRDGLRYGSLSVE